MLMLTMTTSIRAGIKNWYVNGDSGGDDNYFSGVGGESNEDNNGSLCG